MLGEIRGEVRFKEPLSFHTSLRIGGTGRHLRRPAGRGGHPAGAVVRRARAACPSRSWAAGTTCSRATAAFAASCSSSRAASAAPTSTARRRWPGAGVSLSALIREAAALNLGGIECLVGIPATIGGAVAMNAGTPDGFDRRLRLRRLLPPSRRHAWASSSRARARSATACSRPPPGAVLIGARLGLHRRPAAEISEGDQAAAEAEEGEPAARAGLRGLRVEEPARRGGGPARGEGGPQGQAPQRRRDLRQARQLHRQPRRRDRRRHQGADGHDAASGSRTSSASRSSPRSGPSGRSDRHETLGTSPRGRGRRLRGPRLTRPADRPPARRPISAAAARRAAARAIARPARRPRRARAGRARRVGHSSRAGS